jgi:multicomponent Na+:H+ antiporter subunit A
LPRVKFGVGAEHHVYPGTPFDAPLSALLASLSSVGDALAIPLAATGTGAGTTAATSAPEAAVVLALVALPFLGAALTPFVYRLLGERTAYFAASVALACLALVAMLYGSEGLIEIPWIPALGVSLAFYVDGLSLLISFLASGVGVLILAYSGGYMHDEPGKTRYYATLLAFMGSMLGVALAADLVALFVFWELTSVSSFLLIGHYRETDSGRYAARKSLLITVAGGLFMLVAFLLLNTVSARALGEPTFLLIGAPDSLIANTDAVRTTLRETGLFVPVLALIGVGAAAKSAQVPLHIWLPNAMEAPTPVSAFLHSATMVKAGVYLVGRFRPLLVGEEWTLAFAVLGLLTMTVTAMLAVGATDIKELLAYSTASHLGLIIAGFAFASVLGAETGAFHILNHALFKAALFLVAGIVSHEAGTRVISELGGLRRDLPVTAAITAVAALSMAGLPPFNGFYSKELLFETTYEAAHAAGGLWWVFPVVAVFGSVFTFLYSIRFLWLFVGEKPDSLGEVHSPPLVMLVPPAVLALLVVAVSAVPQFFVDNLVGSVVASAVPGEAHGFEVYIPTELSPPVLMSVITIAAGIALSPVYDRLHDGVRYLSSVRSISPNWYYDAGIEVFQSVLSTGLVARAQNGLLRTYAVWVLAAVSALALGGYVAGGVSLPTFSGTSLSLPIIIVLGVAVVGAVAVSIAPSHIAGVLTLSILGFMVALFYLLASAPDLALTQLTVETLVLVVFLLVLDRLPTFYGKISTVRAARDAVLAGVVGITVFTTVLVSTAATPEEPIYTFFVERAPLPDGGGGGNVVNVILVDFRAFDTMGEISVVAMAALSVMTLIAMRERGETQ